MALDDPPLRRSFALPLWRFIPILLRSLWLAYRIPGRANQSALNGRGCHISRRLLDPLKVSRKSFPGPGTRLQVARELAIGRLFSHFLHQCFSVTRRKELDYEHHSRNPNHSE